MNRKRQLMKEALARRRALRPKKATGYQVEKPGTLYVLASRKCVKVGITNRTVEERCEEMCKSARLAFKPVYKFKDRDGGVAKEIESIILEYLRSKYYNPPRKFSGYTECFLEVDLEVLLDEIRYLTYEVTNK